MVTVGLVALALALTMALPVLTAVGDRRRGHTIRHAVLAGLFFPVAWAVWYRQDSLQQR